MQEYWAGIEAMMFDQGADVKRIRQSGFTLIELMITVAIVAILAMIALPSYQQHVLRANRANAQAQMMDIANREQQYFLSERSYATLAQIQAGGYVLPTDLAARYTPTITVVAAPPSFTITFTAKASQLSDGNLTLDSSGVKTPSAKW